MVALHDKIQRAKKLKKSNEMQEDDDEGDENDTTEPYDPIDNVCLPPWLGTIVDGTYWEIRKPFIVPAIRWIARGLIASGHCDPSEEFTGGQFSGAIIPSNLYFKNNPWTVEQNLAKQVSPRYNKK